MTPIQKRRRYALKVGALVFAAWALFMGAVAYSAAHAQEVEQVTVLDHPIDPDLLILSTPDGNYPFKLLAGTDCSWVRSDTSVFLTDQQGRVWTITDGADATCNLLVGTTPCSDVGGACEVEDSQ